MINPNMGQFSWKSGAKAPTVCAHYLIIKKQAIFVVPGQVSSLVLLQDKQGAAAGFSY
ncbi:hypothetical protein [Janthinobacterium sp. MDB2-8]|uniref:hypothetical protein n=1 Tax=Janthinobacterium sp. MDB2-8 TaxID=1259338 RepID=UPI003F230B65